MVERTDPIRQDIEATRASMTDTLEQIEDQVRGKVDDTVSQARRAVDINHQMSERPWLMLGAAITAGFMLGSMGGDSSDHQPAYNRPGEPMRYYSQQENGWNSDSPRHENSHTARRSSEQGRSPQRSEGVSQFADPLREELTLIAAAAMRSAMRALRESLHDSIPQFESEYRAAQRERESDDDTQEQAHAVGASTSSPMSPSTRRPESGVSTTTSGRSSEDSFRTNQSN